MKLKHILWTGLLALILFGVIVALGLKFNWGGDIKPDSATSTEAKQESANQANEIVVDEQGNKLLSTDAANNDNQGSNNSTPTIVPTNKDATVEGDDTAAKESTETEDAKAEATNDATTDESTQSTENSASDEEELPIEPMPTEEEALEQEIIEDEQAESTTPLGEMLDEVLDEKKVMDNIRAECRELSLLSNVPADQLEETIEACVVLTLDEDDPVPFGPEEEVGDIEYENIPEIINDDPEPIPEIIDDEPEAGDENELNVNIIDEMKEGTTVEPKPIKNNANQLTQVSSKSFYELTKKACEIVAKEEQNLSESQRQKLVEECIESNVKSKQNAE